MFFSITIDEKDKHSSLLYYTDNNEEGKLHSIDSPFSKAKGKLYLEQNFELFLSFFVPNLKFEIQLSRNSLR